MTEHILDISPTADCNGIQTVGEVMANVLARYGLHEEEFEREVTTNEAELVSG